MSKEFIKFHDEIPSQRWVFWRNMQKMKSIYQEDCIAAGSYQVFEFSKWLEVNFGIQILMDDNGNVLRDFVIIDEKKYLFYKLKYE